ncbi:hypothetical protein Pst134EA_009712 [Puccinia striiformis f. sp. tritici]|uniref:hypothetical protein n=1 Tax=Puccinia striiformis f. sp. tritici TaxID=168172 RepID=UPI0020080D0C|nr:hypothetical protein Pst134EA_009712 [Puccinia striiformis f. sp. tritici]KAH9469183.1 hypothetical protein Pst134EA_009712 [Puccinia striiformis f. sp. tritici]
MSETTDDQNTTDGSVTASGMASSNSTGSLPCLGGQKAAKRRRINGYKDDEILLAAAKFTSLARDCLAFICKGKIIAKEANTKVQINYLKMLRESVDNLEDAESKEVLQMIQKTIKNKWLST